MTKNQTVYFSTKYDPNERIGVVQEVTSIGYLINNIWYNKEDITINNVLLDSKAQNNEQLLFG